MPDDRFQMSHAEDDASLAAALKALPLEAPPHSAWSQLQRELEHAAPPRPATRGRSPRTAAWLAWAATFTFALIGVRWFGGADGPTTTPATLAVSTDTLALIEQSQQLDAALAALDARSVPMDAGSAMASAELENLIGLTDLQLNATTREDEAQALWSRRVELMSRLAATRTSARFDSLSDRGGASLQNASYRID